MSCYICGRSSCCSTFHSIEEQDQYSKVIDAFEKACELRRDTRERLQQQAQKQSDAEESV